MDAALELDADAAGHSRGTPVHFPGFPGVFEPGVPVAASADAVEAAKELGLPLRVTTMPEAVEAEKPARRRHHTEEADS